MIQTVMVTVLLALHQIQLWRRPTFNFNKIRFPSRFKQQPLAASDYSYYPPQPQPTPASKYGYYPTQTQPPWASDYGYYPTHEMANPPNSANPPNPFYNQEVLNTRRNNYHDPTEVIFEREVLQPQYNIYGLTV